MEIRILLAMACLLSSNFVSATPNHITNHAHYKESIEFIEQKGRKGAINSLVQLQRRQMEDYGGKLDEYTQVLGLIGTTQGMTQTIQVSIDKMLIGLNKQLAGKGKKPAKEKKIRSLFQKGGAMYDSQITMLCSNPSTRAAIDSDVIYRYKFHDQDMKFISEITVNKASCQETD